MREGAVTIVTVIIGKKIFCLIITNIYNIYIIYISRENSVVF